jgi:hypothetical protein
VDIIEYFGAEFLRHSIVTDTQRLLVNADECEFLGMLGSIDYMY